MSTPRKTWAQVVEKSLKELKITKSPQKNNSEHVKNSLTKTNIDQSSNHPPKHGLSELDRYERTLAWVIRHY